MDPFHLKLNCVDHYQAALTEFDPQFLRGDEQVEQSAFTRVPVIRVFGATETGQKVCAHIHGAFPYLFITYDGSLVSDEVNSYIHRLHLSVDHALSVSYRRKVYESKTAFVAHITLVKGIPFYGYHVGYRFFLKIYMLNPLHMTRLADLLRQGTVMKRAFQPYESHMQYLLQWMCDYNLYGCAYIDCDRVMFRGPVPAYSDLNNTAHRWHDLTVPPDWISDKTQLPRQSHCSIEIDICVQHILNRLEIKPRPLHFDFIERTNPIPIGEKLVHSMAGLWRDETRRRKARIGQLDTESSPFPPEVMISVSANPRSSHPGGWIHEKDYMEKMAEIVKDEKDASNGQNISFDHFVQPELLSSQIKTALESIEDLFPVNLAKLGISEKMASKIGVPINEFDDDSVEVDESRILALDGLELPYDSDEAFAQESGLQQCDLSERNGSLGVDEQMAFTTAEEETVPDNKADLNSEFSESAFEKERSGDPESSANLATVGIRDSGDFNETREDSFLVPLEFTSRISSATARHKRAKRTWPASALPGKRQKLNEDGHIKVGRRQKLPDEALLGDDTVLTRGLQGEASIGWDAVHTEPRSQGFGPNSDHENTDVTELLRSSQSCPQEKLPFSDCGSHKLAFPVVKDSHDQNTAPRLSQISQQSDSSGMNPITPGGKHVVSKTGDRAKSDPLSISNFEQFHASDQPPAISAKLVSIFPRIHQAFAISGHQRLHCLTSHPPLLSDTLSTLWDDDIPSIVYQEAHFADERDVPDRSREYAGKEFKLESTNVSYLPDFDSTGRSLASIRAKPGVVVDKTIETVMYRNLRRNCSLRTWEVAADSPGRWEVQRWLEDEDAGTASSLLAQHKATEHLSQIAGPTQKNKYGFEYTQNKHSTSVQHETQYMSLMSLEIHVNTRGNLVPNPEVDEISCIFWCLQSDDESPIADGICERPRVGILVQSESRDMGTKISKLTTVSVEEESSELDMINRMVDIVRDHDPDVLTGFEVHGGSWGYMIERARFKYEYNLCDEFSRMKSQSHGRFGKDNDKWGFNNTSTIRVTGRHMINIWRAMRGELTLLQYTMENIVFHLLHRRIPHFTFSDLTAWYHSERPRDLAKVIEYYISRVQLDLEILEQNELIPRTSEQARLLGVDFFSVFSRGSQFKVESLMFRIAKPENFILVSPSRKQVGQQNALECLPLVMEPQSAFYTSPVLVLDFQSLYPSVMIAYNYCYSTFLGRIVNWRGQNKMGFMDFRREARLVELLKDHINIAPNGIMYVKPEIRKSLLAKMLGEILETRVMVKSGMKVDREDKALQRLLNNRQLALKLIANVTYGYTSASFSGRMPCSEIADSIVQTARETLEKAIALIHSVERWGAEVVYGDTDSLFVHLKGRTKEAAFDIGEEIVKQITDMNPRPIKLKFEKVYHPCILLAKKRYVGFKYENRAQKEPDFDAKGIETVRRDGTPAEQKIEESSLKILFRTTDLSQVKAYFQEQCTKIMQGKVSIQDFCFAKEVKLGTYSDKGPPPPGVLISTRKMLEDPHAEPQYGERVPYVIITGAPGARLIDRCVAPDVLLENEHNELDAEYYISKNLIPPLERIFNLVGANVRQWYDEMPKFQRIRRVEGVFPTNRKQLVLSKKTMESYMKSSACVVCRDKLETEFPICSTCMQHPETSLLTVRTKLNVSEAKALDLLAVCRSCAGHAWGDEVKCDSKDCSVFYTRTRHMARVGSTRAILEPAIRVMEEAESKLLDW